MDMDLELSDELRAFRDEVRAFIAGNFPEDLRRKAEAGLPWERDDHVRWQRILHRHGWGGPGWPVEYGGTGWDPLRRFLFDTECALAGTPREIPFGLNMVAPVIMRYGTEKQKSFFLPRILSLEHWWAQGYSEPGAGSDLASLKTSAVLDGEHYVVNGQKIWTTLAHHANWIFCLVRTRTSGKPQAGISFLLIDMASPGIEVRPIPTIDGEHELNEVWFRDVRVPRENLIGEENEGWTYAKYLLQHERSDIARVGRAQAAMSRLKSAAGRYPGNYGGKLVDDPLFLSRLARAELALQALEVLNLRVLSGDRDVAVSDIGASVLKVVGSEVHQQLSEVSLLAIGPHGALDSRRDSEARDAPGWRMPSDDGFTPTYFNMRKTTIYGGSTEIQKNIIAKVLDI